MAVDRSQRIAKSLKKSLFKKIGGCQNCGQGNIGGSSRDNNTLEVHHYIPRNTGGNDSITNSVLLCRNCHAKVHNNIIKSPLPIIKEQESIMYSNIKSLVDAIVSGDVLKIEETFNIAIMEKISDKINDNKKNMNPIGNKHNPDKVKDIVANRIKNTPDKTKSNIANKNDKEPLDHQQYFSPAPDKINPKNIFVNKEEQNKLHNRFGKPNNMFSKYTKSNISHLKDSVNEDINITEDDTGLPLNHFNHIATEPQKQQLKRLLKSGQHLAVSNFIKSVLNREATP